MSVVCKSGEAIEQPSATSVVLHKTALIWLLLGKEAHTELACLLKSSKISLVRYITTSAIECYGSTRNKFRD